MEDLEQLRAAYQAAVQDKAAAEHFWQEMAPYKGEEAIVLAYKASARALLARFDWNPYNKLSYLKEAMKMYRRAVKRHPTNIEIRFLRFAVQHYLPEFLGESQDLAEDKEVLQTYLPHYTSFHLDKEHVQSFVQFFAESKRFSESELVSLRTQLSIS